MIKTLSLFLSAALCAAGASAAPITPDQLMQHIKVLASDGFEGRAPGTAGGERTEAYILEAFAAAGLKGGAANGAWRQSIRMIERTGERHDLRFSASGRPLALAPDSLALTGRDRTVRIAGAPLIFAGFGTAAELAGTDVRGAVVVMRTGEPPLTQGEPAVPPSRARRIALAEAGAAAVLLVNPAGTPWADSAPGWTTTLAPEQRAMAPVQGLVTEEAARQLLAAEGRDGAALLASAGSPGFRAVRLPVTASGEVATRFKRFDTANIVGKVEGSGRPGEAVVLMGHWDHTGLCAPEGAADRICNGAVDNASGISILLETARALAAGPRPERTIYFLATTLEESGGFVGANSFADSPPPPVDRIVAVLNVDTTAIAPRGLPVAIIGRGRFPAMDQVIDATARSLGREVDVDDDANIMIERQDGWAFAQRGIPSVMATGSVSNMALLRAFLSSSYHRPNDDLNQKIELGGAAEDADLHVALARALADPKLYPTP